MIKKIYMMTMAVFMLVFSINQAEAQVEFKIEILPDNVTYQVSMRPAVTWNSPQNITSSAQVTIKAPIGGFDIDNTNSLVNSTSWSHNSTYLAPDEDLNHDYFSFGLTSLGTSAFNYQAGVEIPIFTFENTGNCTGPVELMAAGDPYYPPNLDNANVGNQITTFGGGQMNAWIGNYDAGSANCGGTPPPPTCNINDVTPTDVTDCGADDGTITVDATGSSTLEYSINGINFQTSNIFNGLEADDYNVTIRTSGSTCTASFAGNPITISEPNAITLNSNSQNPTNCGSEDGTITLTATGGTGNFLYSINGTNYFASGNFNGLSPGSYPVSVKNNNNTCLTSGGNITISAASAPFFSGINRTNPTGCGLQNGTITLSAMGGTGSFQYSINGTDFFPSGSFTGLAAGSYPVAIRNANGTCQVNGMVQTLIAPSNLTVSVAKTDPSICGGMDGNITITATGGTGNYLYSIDNGANFFASNTFSGLADNDYNVVVKNSNNSCETTNPNNPVALNEPACPGNCLVDYVLEVLPDGRYQVSVLPHVTWNMPENLTSTAQVTILAPTGGFSVTNLMNLIPGVTFEHNVTYAAPAENASQDYFVFGLTSQGTQGISYQQGVKVPLFTFENEGNCTGNEIFLLDNNDDPFLPPNLQNANVGQQLSTLGGGQDVEICTSTEGIPCQTPVVDLSCLIAYELELLPNGLYQVSLIPDTTWTGANAITSTAQVTVIAPTEGLVVTNMTNLISGVDFAQNATYVAPTENNDEDYFLFGLTSQGTLNIPYQKGQKVPLFTFENGGVCTGDSIYLMAIEGDPFLPPNLQNANAGQQLTTGGSGPDANLCIVGGPVACVPCGINALDTDGDGICDNEENNTGSDPNDPCDPNISATTCNYVCPDLFNQQDTILMLGNGGTLDICTGVNPNNYNIYDIVVNEVPYSEPLMPCDNDTLIFYTYAFTTGQGNAGPYQLNFWNVNGIPHTVIVQNMNELAAAMNQFDPGGNWINNPQFSAISGGQNGVMYGSMSIKHIATQINTFIQINYTFVSNGSLVEVPGTTGLHEIIATHENGCSDTLYVDVYNPETETITDVFTQDSTETVFCVDNSEIPAGSFTTSICNDPSNGTLTDNGNGCFSYVPNEFFVGNDQMCVVICSDTDPVICDTTYVEINVDQAICVEMFGADTVYVAAINGTGDVCLGLPTPEIDTYDILLDQTQYNQPLGQCDLDTLVFYSYAFVQGQGQTGPYLIESWSVNGNVFSTTVQNMDELATWMNQVGVVGNWQNHDNFAALSGGSPANTYGVMKIRHIQSNIPTQIQPNFTTLVNGSAMTINGLGAHEVILNDPNTGCGDTAVVILVEPVIDTTTVIIPEGEGPEVEICLETTDLPGTPTTITVCENPANGTLSNLNAPCITYTPNAGFIGEEEFCVIICDDSPAPGPFCDTTIVTVIVPPTTDTLGPVVINPIDTTVFCVTNSLQYPGTITSSGVCGENLLEVNVTALVDGCFIFEPVIDFVGYSEVCVLNCYESDITGTEVCDTTIINVFVPPVTDTIPVIITDWIPTELCLTDDINLAGNIQSINICGENPAEVDVEILNLECVTLTPQVGFQGTSEICIVHCDDSVPQICDTTFINVTVEVPCPEIFDVDTIYTSSNALCVPLTNEEMDIYEVIVNGANYNFPIESCNEDTLIFYSYAFTQGAGNAGPYQATWTLNGLTNTATVQTMDALATQMNAWDAGSVWVNNPTSSSISNDMTGDNYGNMTLKRIASGVQTVMMVNYTQIAAGSELHLANPGIHNVVLTDSITNCSDEVVVWVVDTTPDTTIVSTPTNTTVGPICIDNSNLPGNVTQFFCNSASNGNIEFNDLGCLIYTPNTDFAGVEEICIVACSDVMTQEGTNLCDTTYIQIVVLPQTNTIPVVINTPDPTEICLDNELEFSGNIVSSTICGQNTAEVNVLTNTSNCITIDAVDNFVGISEVCVMHCYEVLGIAFCDTTMISVIVLPPTDTIDLTITGYNPDTLCFSNYDVIQLPGNLMTVNICGENTAQLNATVINGNCIELDPAQDVQGLTQVCVVHCDDSNPQFCDTTFININVEFPCPEYFAQDTMVVTNEKLCVPVPLNDYNLFNIIIDGAGYTFPPEPCNEDSLVYYTYSFTVGAGMSGPYAVTWHLNGQTFNGIAPNMDDLAVLMSQWDAGGTWVNDPTITSVRREHTGATFGTMVLKHQLTGVPAFLNANYTSVALGTCLHLGDAGWHEVIVTNNETGCTDTVQVFYYNVDTETITVSTENGTPTTPEVCLNTDGLPGTIASVNLCNEPSNGSVTFNGTCLTYNPTDFFTGIDEFCVVVCDDTPAPFGALCDTTYIQVQVGAPDCDPLFANNFFQIDETPGTGSGSLCVPINNADLDIYDIVVNGAPYAGTTTPCDVDSLVFYTYSFTVGAGQTGPYEMTSWTVNGQTYNGFVSNMNALTALMNQLDPAGNWVNNPTTSSISGGSENSTYGNMVVTHSNTGIAATLNPNFTMIANSTNLQIPVGTNTVIFSNTTNGCVDEIEVVVNSVQDGVLVAPKIFLQGAYNENAGLMRDDLRVLGYLPMGEPYTGYNPISGVFRFNHINGGGETTTQNVMSITGANAIVDWVFLELRSAIDSEEIIATRAALLQRDGDIVDMDGVSPVLFDASAGDYHLAIRHRNHLSVMSLESYPLSLLVTTIDFTDGSVAMYGDNAMKVLTSGQEVMWGGDANGSGLLTFQGANNDPDAIFFSVLLAPGNPNFDTNYILTGYKSVDTNMNGQAVFQGTNNDIDFMIFFNVIGHPNSNFVINYVITEQMP